MDVADLRAIALFDGLSDGQLLELIAIGEEVRFASGEVLFREAQPADHWWVLLAGTIRLVRRVGPEETLLAVMEPGQWAGGFRAWDMHGVHLATGRGASDGRILRVPSQLLRDRAEAWFPFGVHLILGLANTVRRVESVARQRESLVALGTLAAGMAHEINNPASAAMRAVDALANISDGLLSSIEQLADGSISSTQLRELDRLRREINPTSTHLSPLQLADREDALSEWLASQGVERDWMIAPPLAAAGVDIAWCERAAVLLPGRSLQAGLEWVAAATSMATLLSEMKESTGRISELVAAVRSYSQLDRGAMQDVDVSEGLESTLVMLTHRIPDGITVVREYGDDVPTIEAFAAELNQVWTHLVNNALEAMRGSGTLRVSARADEDGVVVEIGDSGPGMSKDVQAHAFDPFFTTKDVGQGTGLGLDVSRRIIVDRHGGDISIEQTTGETVLRVRLPKRPTAAN